jgi:hypothetical protein
MWQRILPILLSLAVVATGYWLSRNHSTLFRPNFARVGGTVLTYMAQGKPDAEALEAAVTALKKRFDPVGSEGIDVRVSSETEIEISIPRTSGHDTLLDRVKRLVPQPGKLTIGFLASKWEDGVWEKASDIAAKQPTTFPPPDPKTEIGDRRFPAKNGNDYAYRWVEMVDAEAKHMATHGFRSELRLVQALKKGEVITPMAFGGALIAQRVRPVTGDEVLFALIREENANNALDASHFQKVNVVARGGRGAGAVSVTLTGEGKQRYLSSLTGVANTSFDPETMPKLALVIDDRLWHTMGVNGRSTRDFTFFLDLLSDTEIGDLACLLRAEVGVKFTNPPKSERIVGVGGDK